MYLHEAIKKAQEENKKIALPHDCRTMESAKEKQDSV